MAKRERTVSKEVAVARDGSGDAEEGEVAVAVGGAGAEAAEAEAIEAEAEATRDPECGRGGIRQAAGPPARTKQNDSPRSGAARNSGAAAIDAPTPNTQI